MIIEVTAPRLLQPFFGASNFVWTNVIGVVLLALALGYRVGGRLADRGTSPRRVALLLLLAALLGLIQAFATKPVSLWLLPDPVTLARVPAAYRHAQASSLLVAAIVFAPPVFLLGMVSPQVIKILTLQDIPVGKASGSVFMWGTMGSLAGTFAPTYLLVPLVGSRQTVLLAAFILALPAAFLLAHVYHSRRYSRVASVAILLGLLAFAALVVGSVSRFPIRGLSDGQILMFETESGYQYLRVVQDTKDDHVRRILQVDSGEFAAQSLLIEGSAVTGAYYDTMALLPGLFDGASETRTSGLAVLSLGGGAGTLARVLSSQWPKQVSRIVNVELDPVVQALSPMFDYHPSRFDIDSLNYVMDGRNFLTVNREQFDLIYIDIYARQRSIPYHIVTAEFFAQVWNTLRPDGIVAINVNQRDLQGPLMQGLARSMAQGRYTVMSTPVEGSVNTIIWSRKVQGDPDLSWRAPVPAPLGPALRHAQRFTTVVDVRDKAPHFTDDHAPVAYLARSFER